MADQLKCVDTAEKISPAIDEILGTNDLLIEEDNSEDDAVEIVPIFNEVAEAEKRAKREKEWALIESLIGQYQLRFTSIDDDYDESSQDAAQELLKKFYPLFKKYVVLLKSGQIDFNDGEMKLFVSSFLDDEVLKKALRRRKQKADFRTQIYKKFNFVKETYGSLPEEEIMIDLNTIFLEMARRYKQMGKSYCGYLYNTFKFEVSRHIKKFTRNPLNIHYKHIEYEDYMRSTKEEAIEEDCFKINSMNRASVFPI